jgi:hypothetical protein
MKIEMTDLPEPVQKWFAQQNEPDPILSDLFSTRQLADKELSPAPATIFGTPAETKPHYLDKMFRATPVVPITDDCSWDEPLTPVTKTATGTFEQRSAARLEKVLAAVDKVFADHELKDDARELVTKIRDEARADALILSAKV